MVVFNYEWYKDTCKEEGLNSKNVVSLVPIGLARDCSIKMKKYMDAKKSYSDKEVKMKFDREIDRLNNKRIGYMLDALQFAELVEENGRGFNEFLIKQTNMRRDNDESMVGLTAVERRVHDRWEKAMEDRKG